MRPCPDAAAGELGLERSPAELDGGNAGRGSPQQIASAYFAGVKRCHRSVLAGSPAQPRKLEMSFTVSVNGRVIRPNVTGPAQDLVACVASLVASWRFPIPKHHDGEPLEVQASMTIDAHD